MKAVDLLAASALALAIACAPDGAPERSEALEMEEVSASLDDELSLDSDEIGERPAAEELSGVLPEDFPPGLPVPAPASVVDLGSAGAGRYVELFSAEPIDRVRSDWLERLRAAGWSASALPGTVSNAGRQVRIEMSSEGGGTSMRLEY